MDKNVEIPGVGVVAFPDSMHDDAIAAAIKANPQWGGKTSTPAVGTPEFAANLASAKNRLNQQSQPGFAFSDSYNDQQGSPMARGAQGVWDAVKGVPAGIGTMAQLGSEVMNPNASKPVLSGMVQHSADRLNEAGKAWNAGSPLGAVQRTAEALPMVGGVGEGIANAMSTGNEAGALGQGVANLGMMAAVPRAAGLIGDALDARALKATRVAHDQAVVELANTLGAKSTEPLMTRAMDQIVSDVGGKQPIVGQSPQGAASRLHQAAEISAAKQAEFVRSNYINQNPQAPISIAAVIPEVKAFLTGGFARANPGLAAALEEGLDTGVIPAEQAYNLKVEMNKYYKPNMADVTAYKPIDARAVGNSMRAQLNQAFGDAFSQADHLQGQIGVVRDLAKPTAGRATLEYGSSGVAPLSPGEVLHATHSPVGAAANAIVRRLPGFKGLNTDAAVAKAVQDMQFEQGPRPEVPPEVAANLREGGLDRSAILNPQQPPRPTLAPDSPAFPHEWNPPDPNVPMVGDAEASANVARRGVQFQQMNNPPQQGSFNADQPLYSHVSPAPEPIYRPPAQRLGDRGISHDEGLSAANKIAYDVTKNSTQPWKPEPALLGSEPGVVRRIMNPQTQRVESWVKTGDGQVFQAPMRSPISLQNMEQIESSLTSDKLNAMFSGKGFSVENLKAIRNYIEASDLADKFPRIQKAVDGILGKNSSMLH